MTNEFTQNMDSSWDSAEGVFGDDVMLLGETYRAIIHGFDQTVVAGLVGGRTRQINGVVMMRTSDWVDSEAKKGSKIILPVYPNLEVRIDNEPARDRSSVRLQVVATVSN